MTTEKKHSVDRNALLARTDLVIVLDSLTAGIGHGHRRRWRCPEPSHPDEHPSVSVTRDRSGTQRWRCWSCGHGGTAIDAVIAAKQLGIGESMRWLNDHHAHLEPMRRDTSQRPRPLGLPSPHVIEYVERAEQLLRTSGGSEIRSWLHARGLDDEVLAVNRVGDDPGRRFLPRRRGLPPGHPAAVFPALDVVGNITYFQARFLDPIRAGQKYGNPNGRLASNPGLSWTRPARVIRRDLPLLITEGVPDALVAARAGMRSIALLGSVTGHRHVADQLEHAVNEGHVPVGVAVCFDADTAGRTGAARLTQYLTANGADVVNVEPPDGMDITDWAARDSLWTDHVLEAASLDIDSEPGSPSRRRTQVGLDL